MSTKERKALGRGFGALLKSVDDQASQESQSGETPQISIEDIGYNPKQPRQSIDPEKLEELAQSIKTKGVIQPILIRPKENASKKYELVAGERRLRASILAGYDKIPAVIKDIKDNELLEIALIENIQRDNLNPIDESKAYRDLLEEHGYTQENLAKRVGKNRSTIANFIRLLQLPEVIQNDLATAELTTGHARALLSLENEELQLKLRNRVVAEKLSVRDIEKAVKEAKQPKLIKKEEAKEIDLTPQMNLNQDRLREHFKTKVKITSKGQRGKIEFEFYNQEDFNRLFSLLLTQSTMTTDIK
ncbi:ParB/RepB/Spo0J family partition protein [bacterium]|nr:ParB/RepB/Spo0J family partition protein [bacterium]